MNEFIYLGNESQWRCCGQTTEQVLGTEYIFKEMGCSSVFMSSRRLVLGQPPVAEWLGAEVLALRADSPGEPQTLLRDMSPAGAHSGLGKESTGATVFQTSSTTADCLQQGILRLEWRRQCRERRDPMPTPSVTQQLPVPFVKYSWGSLPGCCTWEQEPGRRS